MGLIYFFIGQIFSFFVLVILTSLMTDSIFTIETIKRMEYLDNFLRVTYMIGFVFLLTGVAVTVFRKYEINYMHIFGLDYRYKMMPAQIYKLGLCFIWMCSFVMTAALINESIHVKDTEKADSTVFEDWFLVIITLMLFFVWVFPFDVFYSKARFSFLETIF